MTAKAHSPAWYDSLAERQEGYHYPWKSKLPPYHGEDVFFEMVRQHLSTTSDVLEVACAHGDLALSIAPLCRSIVAYDRVASWIEKARNSAEQQGLDNATFLCHDSSLDANEGDARLPGVDDSYDLLICSKGPFHWVEDARRVARPGAVLLMLVPDSTPSTAWHSRLPESLRWKEEGNSAWARPAIEQRLANGGLELDSWWSFDVPEVFPDPQQLYTWLSWGKAPDEIPTLSEVSSTLAQVFDTYANADGIAIHYRRYIWKAFEPEENYGMDRCKK